MSSVIRPLSTGRDVARFLAGQQEREREHQVHTALRHRGFRSDWAAVTIGPGFTDDLAGSFFAAVRVEPLGRVYARGVLTIGPTFAGDKLVAVAPHPPGYSATSQVPALSFDDSPTVYPVRVDPDGAITVLRLPNSGSARTVYLDSLSWQIAGRDGGSLYSSGSGISTIRSASPSGP